MPKTLHTHTPPPCSHLFHFDSPIKRSKLNLNSPPPSPSHPHKNSKLCDFTFFITCCNQLLEIPQKCAINAPYVQPYTNDINY